MATVNAAARLTAVPVLTSASRVSPDGLWAAYLAAVDIANQASFAWRMQRSAGGASGQTGFLFQAAYEAQNTADQAYTAWSAALQADSPGVTG
jgi:hypothetical protein